nr:MAG: ORF1 [Torque teno polar bear virus 18]
MPFYRRNRRWRRRRIPRRRRFKFHYRRRWHPWWRRRPHFFSKKGGRLVRQSRPRYVTVLKVKGVEFLGELGSVVNFTYDNASATDEDNVRGHWKIDIKNVAPTNKEVDYLRYWIPSTEQIKNDCHDVFPESGPAYWNFVGGWGQAHFTLFGLIIRAILAFAKFSRTLEQVRYIKYLGCQFNLQRAPDVSWLFLAEEHRQGQDYEKSLITPLNLLNTPGTVMVRAFKHTHCCRNPKVRVKPDPTTFGWHDIEDFLHVPLVSYVWTAYNPNNPLGRNSHITSNLRSPLENNWMTSMAGKNIADFCPPYNDRDKYDRDFVFCVNGFQSNHPQSADQDDSESWWEYFREQTLRSNDQLHCQYGRYAPFLPPMMAADTPQTIWMRFTFLFQLGGKSFGYRKVSWPMREADVCTPCFPQHHHHAEICTACIHPEDTDKHGILKEKAFERIAGSPKRRKKRALEVLARLISNGRRKRKRVTWADKIHAQKRRKTINIPNAYTRYTL